MKKHSSRFSALLAVSTALFCLPVHKSSALEFRSWLTIDGKIIEAELIRPLGDSVELRDKDGRVLKYSKAQLSFGDLDYINENAPEEKGPKALGSSSAVKPKTPNPAKEVKIDTKEFKKEAGDFKINSRTYRICETPHFKVMYLKPTDPMGIAELAERLWVDTAFFHSTFIPKWHDRKMAIVLVNDQEGYEDVGDWYADMLVAAGNKDGAERTRKTWPQSAAGGVRMPQAQADEHKIFGGIQVFRANRIPVTIDQNGKKTEGKPVPIKGVWVPFNTNVLAADILEVQTGSGGAASTDGVFAIIKGHAYYKEILLTGKSETSMLRTEGSGKDVASSGGFQSDKSWAPELKKMMKKGGEWTPRLRELMVTKPNDAKTKEIVFAWSFARFLQKSTEYLTCFNKLCQKMDVASQVPDLEEIAKIYGFADAAALEKAWIDWMNSGEFH
jgi:hypothetical protein